MIQTAGKKKVVDVPKITFFATNASRSGMPDEVIKQMEILAEGTPVIPATNVVPEWFKKLKNNYTLESGPGYMLNGDPKYPIANSKNPNTVKRCPGVFDFIHAGYIVPSWSDFLIKPNGIDQEPTVEYSYALKDFPGVGGHPYAQAEGAPFWDNSVKDIVKLISPWNVSVSKGVSLMLIQPYYHNSTNFTVMPGLMDSDLDMISNRSIQIFIKINTPDKDIFIERGTPLLQIFPFKRSDYKFECVTRPTEDMYKDFNVLEVKDFSRIHVISPEATKDAKCPLGQNIPDPNRRNKRMIFNRHKDDKNYNKKD